MRRGVGGQRVAFIKVDVAEKQPEGKKSTIC